MARKNLKPEAAFHRATFNHEEYRDFFSEGREDAPLNGGIPYIIRKFDRISPEVFGPI